MMRYPQKMLGRRLFFAILSMAILIAVLPGFPVRADGVNPPAESDQSPTRSGVMVSFAGHLDSMSSEYLVVDGSPVFLSNQTNSPGLIRPVDFDQESFFVIMPMHLGR